MNWWSLNAKARLPSSRTSSPPSVNTSRSRSSQCDCSAVANSASRGTTSGKDRGIRRLRPPPLSNSTPNLYSSHRTSGCLLKASRSLAIGRDNAAITSACDGGPPAVNADSVSSITCSIAKEWPKKRDDKFSHGLAPVLRRSCGMRDHRGAGSKVDQARSCASFLQPTHQHCDVRSLTAAVGLELVKHQKPQ